MCFRIILIKCLFSIEKKNVDFVKLERKVHLPYIPPRILRNYATGKSFPNADCKFLYPMADSKFRSHTSYKSEIVDHERLFYRPRWEQSFWINLIITTILDMAPKDQFGPIE